jgi:WD40 repeat protein
MCCDMIDFNKGPRHQNQGTIVPFSVPFNTERIPDDLWEKISSYLEEAKQVATFIGTNRHFYTVGVSSSRYQALLEKYFPCAFARASSPLNYRYLYQECGLRTLHLKKLGAPFETFSQGSDFCVHENFLITFQYNGKTKITDIESRQLIHTLDTGLVSKFQIRGDFLYLLGASGVQAWDIRMGRVLFRIDTKSCSLSLNFLELEGDCLYYASAGEEQDIHVLNVRDLSLGIQVMKTGAEIISLQACGNLLFFAGIFKPPGNDEGHGFVTIVDRNTQKLKDWAVSCNRLQGMEYCNVQGNFLIMVTPHFKEGGIAIWEVSTGKSICKKPPLDKAHSYHTQGNFLIGVGTQKIKIWDIRTGEILHELNTTIRETTVSQVHGDFLFIFSFYKPAPEVWKISTGKKIGDTSYLKGPLGCSGLQIDKDFLCINSDGGIIAWDLMPHSSIYELNPLVRNLNVLKKMADSPPELQSLSEALDPRLQWELNQYCLALTGTDAPFPNKGILHMQIIVHLEMLLHIVHKNDPKWLSELLDQIAIINPDIPLKLYEQLREQCNPNTLDATWGERAFKGGMGVCVPRREKIQAVQTLQSKLRENSSE